MFVRYIRQNIPPKVQRLSRKPGNKLLSRHCPTPHQGCSDLIAGDGVGERDLSGANIYAPLIKQGTA
jgi:hypothetical protein